VVTCKYAKESIDHGKLGEMNAERRCNLIVTSLPSVRGTEQVVSKKRHSFVNDALKHQLLFLSFHNLLPHLFLDKQPFLIKNHEQSRHNKIQTG